MKRFSITLATILLTIHISYTQQECYTNDDHARDGCFDFTTSIPTTTSYQFGPVTASNSSIKTIQCIVHVVRRSNGTDNFQNTTAHKNIIAGRFGAANTVFSANQLLSHNVPGCPSIYLTDTRLSLNIAKYQFHNSDDLFCAGSPSSNPGACDFYTQFVTNNTSLSASEKNNSLHVFIIGCRKSGTSEFHAPGGYSAGIPVQSEKFIVVKSWYEFLVTRSPPQEQLELSQNLAHEVGHSIGLHHAFLTDYLCDTYDGTSGQTNNVMDYQQDQQESFSRTQIERMHYFLLGHSGDAYKVNSSAVTKPTPSITGPSVLCPIGADYFVSNHQLGTVVSWSVSPSNAVQVSSGSGTSAHLVSNSTYSGSASITFLVNYGYFGTKSNSYSFTVGNGIYGTVTSGGSTTPLAISHAVSSTSVSASIDAPGATSFTWTKTSGSGSWYTYNNGKSLSLTLSTSASFPL